MVKSVEEEPTIVLRHWHLVYHDDIGYRLVGIRQEGARISSPVVDLDVAGGRAVTESGREYRLIGEPDPEAVTAVIARIERANMLRPGSVFRLADADEFEGRPRTGLH